MTFEEICVIEPRLQGLLKRVPEIITAGQFWVQWASIKQEFSKLAGWEAEKSDLRTERVYDIVYAVFLRVAEETTPDCP